MIRFSCPTCDREYILPDALAHLPLLCKGCGHQMIVPEPSPEPEPDPPPPPPPRKPPPKSVAPPIDEDDEPLFESPLPDLGLDPDPDATPMPPPKSSRPRPAVVPPPPPAPKPRGGRKGLGVAVDVGVALILVAGGVFLGEMVAQKPTREVMAGATGPKFPPLDLLMWLAPSVVLLLVYMLLGSRGKTLGAWLRRRAA